MKGNEEDENKLRIYSTADQLDRMQHLIEVQKTYMAKKERMIRVELENGRGIFANSSDQINVYMEDTEPVAPKGWRPLCTTFTVYDFETNTCNGFIVNEILEDECIDCIYRKRVK